MGKLYPAPISGGDDLQTRFSIHGGFESKPHDIKTSIKSERVERFSKTFYRNKVCKRWKLKFCFLESEKSQFVAEIPDICKCHQFLWNLIKFCRILSRFFHCDSTISKFMKNSFESDPKALIKFDQIRWNSVSYNFTATKSTYNLIEFNQFPLSPIISFRIVLQDRLSRRLSEIFFHFEIQKHKKYSKIGRRVDILLTFWCGSVFLRVTVYHASMKIAVLQYYNVCSMVENSLRAIMIIGFQIIPRVRREREWERESRSAINVTNWEIKMVTFSLYSEPSETFGLF